MTLHIFSGPTIGHGEVTAAAPLAAVHSPIRHGDLFRLDVTAGDTVVMIDGVWHQHAPIRHKEILDALARGVTVVGAASTGALRAAELHPYGMIGVGRIFSGYRDGLITADDEVAVAQDPDSFDALSVALVTIRFALADACTAGAVSPLEQDLLLSLARQLPYTRRSWELLARRAAEAELVAAWRRFTAWRPPASHDCKHTDAVTAIITAASGAVGGAGRASRGGHWTAGTWRTSFLREWQAKFTPVAVPQTTVAALLRHQMLYDPWFPGRWRARVLAWIGSVDDSPDIARAAGGAADPLPHALRVAAGRGLRLEGLSGSQRAYWLTAREIAELRPDEAMARILVRSARLDTAAERIWPATLREASKLLNPAMDSADVCERARQVNEAVAAAGDRYSLRHLRGEVVRRHLAGVWGLPDEPAELDGAARDRGFHDLATAVGAARSFYLEAKHRYPSVAAS